MIFDIYIYIYKLNLLVVKDGNGKYPKTGGFDLEALRTSKLSRNG